MSVHILRIEGLNFNQCLFDTDNISVVRGASCLMEDMAEKVGEAIGGKAPLISGGSLAVFRVEANAVESARKAAEGLLSKNDTQHLTFAVTTGAGDRVEDAMGQAENAAKLLQLQTLTYRPFMVEGPTHVDALDRKRPVAVEQGKTVQTIQGKLASRATWARWAYGKKARKKLLLEALQVNLDEGDEDHINFCHSLDDLVRDKDGHSLPKDLSPAIKNKIAVVHLDGDRFSQFDKQKLSSELNTKLEQVKQNLVKTAWEADCPETEDKRALRMQILMWGGDDITFVVPAWRLFDSLQSFYGATAGWQINGSPVTFTAGAIVANKKAPIRLLNALAHESVEIAKAKNYRSTFSLDVFESTAPPEPSSLATYRCERLVGGASSIHFAFAADRIQSLLQTVRRYKFGENPDQIISRSKIYALLRRTDMVEARKALETYLARTKNIKVEDLTRDLSLPLKTNDQGGPIDISTHMFWLLQVWDYVLARSEEPGPGEGSP